MGRTIGGDLEVKSWDLGESRGSERLGMEQVGESAERCARLQAELLWV